MNPECGEGLRGLAPALEPATVTRRSLLAGAAALALPAMALALPKFASAAVQTKPGPPPLPRMTPIPDGAVRLADFAPNEQRIARHLKTLVALANAVEDRDPATYGFITGDFWRMPYNKPFNARVQENALTLAYFLAADRPWNPVKGDRALLARLEAALEYWLSLQNPNGSFPEYKPDEFSVAATGFALSHIGHLVTEVRPPIRPDLRARVVAALRRATDWTLDPGNRIAWIDRIDFSNQVIGGLAGIAALLKEFNDPALGLRLDDRARYVARTMQSPAGFYYENGEVDHVYSMNVMSDDLLLLHRARPSPVVVAMQRRYYDWASYNQIWEPDGAGFLSNNAISGRSGGFAHDADSSDGIDTSWGPEIPQARAYLTTRESLAAERAAFAKGSWADLPPLKSVGPNPVSAVAHPEHVPTAAQRRAAIGTLPYLRSRDFTEYRRDPKSRMDFMFVRRPGLYLGMSFGPRSRLDWMSYASLRRGGPGFLWHPDMGMVVYGTNGDKGRDDTVWSTVRTVDGREQVDAAQDLFATYLDVGGERELDPARFGPGQDFAVAYRPAGDWARKRLTVRGSDVDLRVDVEGSFIERIPLVIRPGDLVAWSGARPAPPPPGTVDAPGGATGLTIERNGKRLTLDWTGAAGVKASLVRTDRTAFRDKPRRLHTLTLRTADRLDYRVRIA